MSLAAVTVVEVFGSMHAADDEVEFDLVSDGCDAEVFELVD